MLPKVSEHSRLYVLNGFVSCFCQRIFFLWIFALKFSSAWLFEYCYTRAVEGGQGDTEHPGPSCFRGPALLSNANCFCLTSVLYRFRYVH